MKPEKLVIQYETAKDKFDGKITALFNPAQLSYTSTTNWDHVDGTLASKSAAGGTNVFRTVAPDTLTLSLFFDTYAPYDSASAGGLLGLVAGAATEPKSVVTLTSQVLQLARLNKDLHRPPVCLLKWGRGTLLRGVLQRATRTFVLFADDGTPVRATMECTFLEVPPSPAAPNELYSADVAKRYLVRPGDTLMGIAAAHYGDGARWRVIAGANGIEDPRRLTPGLSLTIPRVR
jgi:nucleoid-associated protein YgaU